MMEKEPSGILKRPWLWLPSRLAHDLAPYTLPLVTPFLKPKSKEYQPKQWRGLRFQNPLGLAGGVDKTGQSLPSWNKLGAGFLEVGTVTPEPQGPNSGKIMARDVSKQALWNKMGFPNAGMDVLANRLKAYQKKGVPLLVNIGRNRWTKNEEAFFDYGKCIEKLHPYADIFVVNVSSPNTKGLRELLNEKDLKLFLENLTELSKKICPEIPLLLKLSPDMGEETLEMALSESAPFVDGWILTNTTKSREKGLEFPQNEGGVSGLPLTDLSRQALLVASEYKRQYPEKLLISTGGIDSADEVSWRLAHGADLVQFYSALVFHGPGFFGKVLDQLQSKGS